MTAGPVELVASGFVARVVGGGEAYAVGRWTTGLAAEARVAVPVVICATGERFREQIEMSAGGTRSRETPLTTWGAGLAAACDEAAAQ